MGKHDLLIDVRNTVIVDKVYEFEKVNTVCIVEEIQKYFIIFLIVTLLI